MLFRFPDGEFEAFGQVILFGVKREKYQPPAKAQIERFQAWGADGTEILPLEPGDGRYVLPPAPEGARFEYIPWDDTAMTRLLTRLNLPGGAEWDRLTYVPPLGAPIKPLTQLKIGHLSMLISAGEVGVVEIPLAGAAGGPVLVKGQLAKKIERTETDITNDAGDVTGKRVEERERLETVITLLHPGGRREQLASTQAVSDFITANASALADAVLAHNQPFYDWRPTGQEWTKVGRLALGLPPLPGRAERGLFDVQKHFAIAAARRMRAHHHAILMCEMGWGKTSGAIAALELRDRWPALVMCPGHMVEKWRRDLEAVSDAEYPICARIITKPARAETSWLAERILPLLNEAHATLVADERWQVVPVDDQDTGRRRKLTIRGPAALAQSLLKTCNRSTIKPTAQFTPDGFTLELMDRDEYTLADFFADYDAGRLGPKAAAIIAFEPAKYDAGLRTLDLPKRWLKLWDPELEQTLTVRAPCCPACGKPLGARLEEGRWVRTAPVAALPPGIGDLIAVEAIRKGAGEPSSGSLKQSASPIAVIARSIKVIGKARPEHEVAKVPKPLLSPIFTAALQSKSDDGVWTIGGIEVKIIGKTTIESTRYELSTPDLPVCPHHELVKVLDEAGKLKLEPDGQPLTAQCPCGARLYAMSRWRRVGLSRLIQRQYSHRFQVYIADEVHESAGSDTDIGAADGRLLSSIRDSLALSGTLFGGAASSLFYLLYRRSPEVRQLYGYKEVSRWVDHFGLWKFKWSESKDGRVAGALRGASSGVLRWDVRPPDELPGVSPAVARYLLPLTLFGKITDLGYTLPPLRDEVQTVPMGKELADHVHQLDRDLLQKAMRHLTEHHDPSLLTTWFATLRFRPMSAFRDETVMFRGKPLMDLPAVACDTRDLPKEQKLADLVRASRSRGRKVLVFVEQTGTRDTLRGARLAATLQSAIPGVQVEMLSSDDMKPAKREQWIRRRAPQMDVLLVNAGLVKTGLDLVMFSDIVFYETNTSLYCVWQSVRRVWRLGQKNPVTTTFLAYNAALEAALLDTVEPQVRGDKMKAAMLLYGDSAAGALVDTSGDDDLAREITRSGRALEGTPSGPPSPQWGDGKRQTIAGAGDLNGKSIFASGAEAAVLVTDSPLGSPVATSAALPMLAPEPILLAATQFDLFGNAVNIAALLTKPKGRRR